MKNINIVSQSGTQLNLAGTGTLSASGFDDTEGVWNFTGNSSGTDEDSSDNASDLGEDMLEVQMGNGCLVTAGWYPEAGPTGCYWIQATIGLKPVGKIMRTTEPSRAVEFVGKFAQTLEHYVELFGPITE